MYAIHLGTTHVGKTKDSSVASEKNYNPQKFSALQYCITAASCLCRLYWDNFFFLFLFFFFYSNLVGQGGNVGRRDVGGVPDTGSKLNDMQNAIETLTHSVNHMATKQQVRRIIV